MHSCDRNGLRATVSVTRQSNEVCRLMMVVEDQGRALWRNEREVPLRDADCASIERTAIDAASAIADHLMRRRRLWGRT